MKTSQNLIGDSLMAIWHLDDVLFLVMTKPQTTEISGFRWLFSSIWNFWVYLCAYTLQAMNKK